ncbi:CBS domain-containing protein [Candidatus Nanosyncoccus nanoralicus]|nr:CBS domain-containing protein [Candidatus Nanosyncoccus nanoralicus]
MSADQSADLNQSSGIFNEQKKGFFAQIGEKFGGLFRGIARTLGKIAVEKKISDDESFDGGRADADNGNFESTSKHENINESANSVDSSFVGPMNRNIFTDKDAAANLVRRETEMSEIEGVSESDADNNTDRSININNQNISSENLPEIFYPETTEDLVWLINKLPEEVISKQQRRTMAAAMTFDSKLVKEVMTPKNEVIIIHENDFMGPLTLSRLYQSGLSHFPVVGARGEIVGLIHTKTLFSLSVKETDRASAFLDKNVYFMSENYTLKEALLAFIRTSCYFFIVVDDHGKVTGLMSFDKLIEMIVGDLPETDFDMDQDLMSVVKYARTLKEPK